MVVCLCKGVSDKTIRFLVQGGKSTVRDVMQACRAGTDCGTCVCQIKEIVEKTRAEQQASAIEEPAAAIEPAANQ